MTFNISNITFIFKLTIISMNTNIIIIAIILLFTFLGYKRGLIKVAINLCTFIIAIIIALLFYKPIANVIISNTNIDESIQTAITESILPDDMSSTEEVEIYTELPNIILKNSENTVESISNSFSTIIIETACLLIIFIAIKIVLKFITVLADLIAKLPILNQFNKLGGTLYGILEGVFIVFVGFALISLIAPLIDVSILNSINDSTIGSILYNHNLLLKFIV